MSTHGSVQNVDPTKHPGCRANPKNLPIAANQALSILADNPADISIKLTDVLRIL